MSWLKQGAAPVSLSWEIIFGTAALAGGVLASGRSGLATFWKLVKRNATVRKDEQLPSAVDKKRKSEMPETFMFLGLAWASSGYVGQAVDLLLCALAIAGVPLTLGTSRVLQVLLAHLYWVAIGSVILQKRLGDFYRSDRNDTDRAWFVWAPGRNLFLKVLLGYWLSAYLSQVAIGLNGLLAALEVPGLTQLHLMLRAIPESATEAALDNLKNPQSGGVLAQAIGAVGPVLTGPIWEEVLYRGFLLSALALYMSVPTAVDVAALIFALNHMNARAFAQLYVLGYLWSMLYIRTKSLMVPILVHMLWNGRTFLAPM